MPASSPAPSDRFTTRPSAVVAHAAPPPDRRELEDRAVAAAAVAATGPDTAAAAFEERATQWLAQWTASAGIALEAARKHALDRIRDTGTALSRATARLDLVIGHLALAREKHDRLADITAGRAPGDDGGSWTARARPGRRTRGEHLADALLYGGAAAAEIGLNYLAFQIMGSSAWETAVLAAAIVLVNVLLPKQLGELAVRHRRAASGRGRLLACLLLGTGLWIGVSLFVALVRTAFLLLPTGSAGDLGAPALIVEAGLSGETLTWGWLAVVLAVGLVVLLRAASRYNPYVTALATVAGEVGGLEQEKLEALTGVQAAQLDVQRAWAALRTLPVEFDEECARLAALARDVVCLHRAELDRQRGSGAVVALRASTDPEGGVSR